MIDILIVRGQDTENLASFLGSYADYNITESYLENLGLAVSKEHFDMVIAPLGEGEDRFKALKIVLRINKIVPVVIISNLSSYAVAVEAFKLGASEYVRLPYSYLELQCRMRVILNRTLDSTRLKELALYDYTLLPKNNRLLYRGRGVSISSKEGALLEMFFSAPNVVISKADLLIKGWGRSDHYTAKSLDAYLVKLRKLLNKDKRIKISNVRGVGYRLEA